MLKPALVPAALIALLLVVPAPAHGACGVATAKADYESPEIQLYSRGVDDMRSHIACLRATGKQRLIGTDSAGEGSAATSVRGVYGRWLWLEHAVYDPDSDSRDVTHELLDVQTGKKARTRLFSEVVALPGALVVASDGVTARFTDGRSVKLSTDAMASGLAAVGSRVYWRTGDMAHTAELKLPKAAAAAKGPVATKVGRCVPRKGARLELFDVQARAHAAGREDLGVPHFAGQDARGRRGQRIGGAVRSGDRLRARRAGRHAERAHRRADRRRGHRVRRLRDPLAGRGPRRPAQPGRPARGGSGHRSGAGRRLRLLPDPSFSGDGRLDIDGGGWSCAPTVAST